PGTRGVVRRRRGRLGIGTQRVVEHRRLHTPDSTRAAVSLAIAAPRGASVRNRGTGRGESPGPTPAGNGSLRTDDEVGAHVSSPPLGGQSGFPLVTDGATQTG